MADNFFTDQELSELRATTLEELTELHEQIGKTLENASTGEGENGLKEAGLLFHKVAGTAGIAGFEEISILGNDGVDTAGATGADSGKTVAGLKEITDRIGALLRKISYNSKFR